MKAKRFVLAYRGYNTQAVDEYIGELENRHSGAMRTAKDRIALLEQEKQGLEGQLNAFRKKEQALSDALVQAQKSVSEAKEYAAKLAEVERNRLQTFCDKWTDYARKAMDETNPKMLQTLQNMQLQYAQEVAGALQRNLFCHVDAMYPEYQAEKERVAHTKQSAVHIEELLEKLKSDEH